MKGMSIVMGAFQDSEDLAKLKANAEDETFDQVDSPVLEWHSEDDSKMDEEKQPSVLSPRALETNHLFPDVAWQQEAEHTTPSSWVFQEHHHATNLDSSANNVPHARVDILCDAKLVFISSIACSIHNLYIYSSLTAFIPARADDIYKRRI
jgi:hypothetical protein